ncbi:MAG: dienelactone hydrolase family protein [Acidobacteriota bacterium]
MTGGEPVRAGAAAERARAALVLVHGRGATPESILPLGDELLAGVDGVERDGGVHVVAPRAVGGAWYPASFMAPTAANEPFLSSARRRLEETVDALEASGIERRRIVLAGFSQGACLALDVAARAQRPWGGVGVLSGGLIGPPGTDWRDLEDGSLESTPVFLGCSDRDPHVPLERVRESARVLRRLGAAVDERIYPGMPHTVVRDEVDALRAIVAEVADGAR